MFRIPSLRINIQKKRESLYLLLVTLFEALDCPSLYERATQRPHANMYMHISYVHTHECHAQNTYPQKTSTVASFLTVIEIFQISKSQERA